MRSNLASFMRRGSAGAFILGFIAALAAITMLVLFVLGDESDTDDDDAWYESDEDYTDDDEIWDTWKIDDQKRSKVSKKHGAYGDGVFKSEAELRAFVNKTASNTDEVWTELFAEYKKPYRKPKFKLFEDSVATACGDADTDDGPFYCSEDETIYLDLNFMANMSDQIGTSGEFAIAYVIAHEYGHHIQNLVGDLNKYSKREEKLREQGKEKKANLVSVQTELQADFYAGVWASRYDEKHDLITEDDIVDALNAADAVGDDALGEDRRENFGHGSSEMRMKWLIRGMVTGDVQYGNTYDFKSLKKLEDVDTMLDDDDDAK